MHHVFISYSRRDAPQVAHIVGALKESEIEVWIDRNDIPISVPWMEEIREAIRASALLVTVDSEHWFSSEHCVVEEHLAESMGKQVLHIDVATPPSEAAKRVTSAIREYGPREQAMTELLVRSTQWDRAGSPRRELARGRDLRRYVRAARGRRSELPGVATRYIAKSSLRQVRRWLFAGSTFMVLSLVANMGELYTESIDGARDLIDQRNTTNARLALLDEDRQLSPTIGLANTVQVLGNEAVADQAYLPRLRLLQALADPVPTPTAAGKIGDADPPADERPTTGRQVRLGPSGAVRVLDAHGQMWRTYRVQGTPSTWKWSKDGRLLAIGVFGGIEIIHVESGSRRQLRGAHGQITAVDWTGDDNQVLATDSEGRTSAWEVSQGTHLLDDPTLWVMDMEWIPNTNDVIVLSRDGRILRVNVVNGQSRLVADVRTVSSTVAVFEHRVVVSHVQDAARRLTLVDVDSGDDVPLALPGCDVEGVTALQTIGLVGVACGSSGAWVVDPATGNVVARHPTDEPVVTVGDLDEDLLIGTSEGNIFALPTDPSAERRRLAHTCTHATTQIRVAQHDAAVVHAGSAFGTTNCAVRVRNIGGRKEAVDHIIFSDTTSRTARGLALSQDGAWVSYGFADGTIWTFGVTDLNPRALRRDVLGEIRGLAYSPDRTMLVAVTRDGVLTRFATDLESMSVDDLIAHAQARLSQANAPVDTGEGE